MTSSQVVTGEAVSLDLRPAALPSRVLAGVIDGVLQLLVLLLLGGLFAALSLDVSDAVAASLTILLLISVFLAYPVLFETLLRGRTPGKAAMGLRVVRDDGGPIGFRHALVRGLTGAFLERPGLTFFVAGVVTMLAHSRDKRVGDLLAGTVVLQERVSTRGGQVAEMPPQLTGWAASLDLSGLGDDLALSARQFISRSRDLTPAAREDLGGRLVNAVLEVVRPAPPAGTAGWAVLTAVLAERRRREQQRISQTYGESWRSATSYGGEAVAATPVQPVSSPSSAPVAWPQAPENGPQPPKSDPEESRQQDAPPPTGPGGFVAPF